MISDKKIKEIITSLGDAFDRIDAKEYPQVSITTTFDVIHYSDEEPSIDIVTGNKESPAGISISDSEYIMFISDKGGYFIKSKDDIKRVIKENFTILKQKFNKEHKITYILPFNLIF